MNQSTKYVSNVSTVVVAFVDKSRVMAGAEWNICILAKHFDKSFFHALVVPDFPLTYHTIYKSAEAEVCCRANGLKWWMGSDRWSKPLRGTDAIKRIIFACQLMRVIKRSHVKVIHIALLDNTSWVDLVAAKIMGLKTVGSVNSLLSQRYLNKRCLSLCDSLICGSDFVAREIDKLIGKEKITRIYSPISVAEILDSEERIAEKFALGMTPETIVISSVAMLDPRKGHDVAIQAFAKLAAEFPTARLLIVGGAYAERGETELKRLQRLASDFGVSSRVVFAGYISELRKVYAASDIVLALSIDGEAFGRVTAEAAAHGRVVVATAIGATPEIIQDGVTGFLVQPGNASAVTEKCRQVLGDENLARRIGVAAREFVAEKFHPDIITRQTEDVYKTLLEPGAKIY